MAYAQIPGNGPTFPYVLGSQNPPSFNSQLLIDATGEKAAFIGRVWYKGRTGSKNIARVGFLFGTIVKAGGSGLTVSLQDVDLANGAPGRPDGTQDQTVAIANGDASFASDTFYRTGALSANRTVNFADRLSIVVEFDGGGRLGSDSVILKQLAAITSGHRNMSSGMLFTSSWGLTSGIPNIILEFDDGTFGTLAGSFPCSAIGSLTYNSGSTPDEYCLEGAFNFPCKVDGAEIPVQPSVAGSDFDIVAYSGTTSLGSDSVDGNTVVTSGATRDTEATFAGEITLAANTTYRLAVKPTSANNVVAYYFDVADANHLTCHDGGTGFVINSRTDAGAWGSPTTTRRLFAGWRLSSLDDGAGSGGAGPLLGPGRLVRS